MQRVNTLEIEAKTKEQDFRAMQKQVEHLVNDKKTLEERVATLESLKSEVNNMNEMQLMQQRVERLEKEKETLEERVEILEALTVKLGNRIYS
jgi:predicted  nucleic acid-binding Zn-ribbon protein